MARLEALRRVTKIHDDYCATLQPFSLHDVFRDGMLACTDLGHTALEGMVAWAVQICDDRNRHRRSKTKKGPRTLFNMEGTLSLGDKVRIDKRAARREHLLKALEISDANAASVAAANQEDHEEFERLEPYLGPDVMMCDAVEKYYQDNEDQRTG